MKTITKALFGAAMLTGSALALAAPASAQPNYGYSNGDRSYGETFRGDRNGGYDRDRGSFHDTRGFWRWDARLHRRVWVAYGPAHHGRDDNYGHQFNGRAYR